LFGALYLTVIILLHVPGDKWYQKFLSRNPTVTQRTAQLLGHERADISETDVRNWFHDLDHFLSEEYTTTKKDILSDPRRIFNADESGFPLAPKTGKVLAPKGAKHVYQVSTSDKTQITTLACMNAMGQFMNPMILFPGQRIRDVDVEEYQEAFYQCTETGWMTAHVFRQFLELFDTFVSEKSITRPVLLFVDGHSSHISLESSEFCAQRNIILYCLHPHTSHITQPCDVGFFGPLKSGWHAHLRDWQMAHLGEPLTKKQFPGLLKNIWSHRATFQNAASAFKSCGLFPLDPDALDYSKLKPSMMKSTSMINHPGIRTPAMSAITPVTTVTETTPSSDIGIQPVTSDRVLAGCDLGATIPPVCVATTPENGEASINVTPAPKPTTPENATIPSNLTSCATLPSDTHSTHTIPGTSISGTYSQSYVSPAFSLLQLPSAKNAKKITMRHLLPKAVSGKSALLMMKEREEKKNTEIMAKQERKCERERKRKEREELKLHKKEEANRKKLELSSKRKQNAEAKPKKKVQKRRPQLLDDTSSEDSDEVIVYDDSDDIISMCEISSSACPACDMPNPDIGCDFCPRFWHKLCTGYQEFAEMQQSDIEQTEFMCNICQFS
jgi:hypothetical protein